MNDFSVIIVGCGSIGSRHARNCRSLGVENIILFDPDIERTRKLSAEIKSSKIFASLDEAIKVTNSKFNCAIIASPSNNHVEQSVTLAKNKIHIFIEKPLATSLEGIDNLSKLILKNKVVVMMGQSYRFHEGYVELNKHINKLGKIYHAHILSGQYLPDWHPDRDYRTEYAAQASLGGGVNFTSMSHIFDIVQWLFGDIKKIERWKEKLSSLDMDVDDSTFCLTKTERDIVAYCQSDFLDRVNRHQIKIVGEKATVEADMVNHEIKLTERLDGKNVVSQIKYQFEPNYRYVAEIKHFFNLVREGNTDHDLSIDIGKKIVRLMV